MMWRKSEIKTKTKSILYYLTISAILSASLYTVKNNYPKHGNREQICGVKRELPCRMSTVYNSMAGYSFYHAQGLDFLPNIVQFF